VVALEQPPNIIFLMTDDQRWDSLGCMGNEIIKTPNIDTMAKRSVIFDEAFTTTPICMTSRACVFTGQYAARHKIWDFKTDLTADQLANTYLGKLKSAGYRTGFIGKWGIGHPRQANSILDYHKGFPGQSHYFKKGTDPKLKQGRHLTARMGDQALEFIEGCTKEQPFHLSISFKAPHCQDSMDLNSDQFPSDKALADLYGDITIEPPETAANHFHESMPDFMKTGMNRKRWEVRFRSPERYQKSVKDYYRLITGVDATVGRIREKLEQAGMSDNTIIIFTSDHGFFLGEYGFAGKWLPHDVSIRVPLIIHDPRDASVQGNRSDAMALLIDMAPTILDFAGVESPEGMQGKSLRSVLAGQTPADWRDSFFYEHLFSAGDLIAPTEGVRNGRWKYGRYLVPSKVKAGKSRWEELYDLKNDPQEKNNLAQNSEFEKQLKVMRQKWKKLRQEVK